MQIWYKNKKICIKMVVKRLIHQINIIKREEDPERNKIKNKKMKLQINNDYDQYTFKKYF